MLMYIIDPLVFFLEIKRVMKEECIFVFDFKNLFCPRAAMHYFIRIFRKGYESDKERRYSIFY